MTEAEARVGSGRPAAQKAIDKTAAGFKWWSVTKHGAGMRLAGTRKAKTAALCRAMIIIIYIYILLLFIYFLFSDYITILLQRPLGGSGPESPTL
jgi:multidrug efflux pump subunit AcrB